MAHFEDALAINAAATIDRNAVLGAGVLTLLSIKSPFHTMPFQLESVSREGGRSCHLWGFKREGYRRLIDCGDWLMARANTARGRGSAAVDELVCDIVLTLHGFGIVKASFLAQLLVGDGACLDSHNGGLVGIGPRTFEFNKARGADALRECVTKYRALWEGHGSSSWWWDRWCDYVAGQYPEKFVDGSEVSRLHRLAIDFKPYEYEQETYLVSAEEASTAFG